MATSYLTEIAAGAMAVGIVIVQVGALAEDHEAQINPPDGIGLVMTTSSATSSDYSMNMIVGDPFDGRPAHEWHYPGELLRALRIFQLD